MVAAWINADTGVGPSIASGNQVCRPSWADFPMAPKNKNIQIKSIAGISKLPIIKLKVWNEDTIPKTVS